MDVGAVKAGLSVVHTPATALAGGSLFVSEPAESLCRHMMMSLMLQTER